MSAARILFACASLACFLPSAALAQSSLSFTRHDITSPSFGAIRGSAAGDFNADGRADLVVATARYGSLGEKLLTLLGNGDGTFAIASTMDVPSEVVSFVVGDFNGDGRQDFAASAFYSNAIVVRLGNGDGTFTAAADIGTDFPAMSLVLGDFDGDNAPDLAATILTNGDSEVRIYRGDGDGTFTQGQVITEGAPRQIVSADFNGDGVTDLAANDFAIVNNQVENSVLILLGAGDGTFTPVSDESVIGLETRAITVGDFNGDGRQDVVTTADRASILLGNGDGTFQPVRHLPPDAPPGAGTSTPSFIKVADFNGDGRADFAIGNEILNDPPVESTVSVKLGRGDGTFESTQQVSTAQTSASLVVADWNNDGRPDLATTAHETSTITVLLNGASAAVSVKIDIRPTDPRNRINLRSNGFVSVAILSRNGFDATEVDANTVRFGRTGTEAAPVRFGLADIDGDGTTDILIRFRIHDTGIVCGDTSASLKGATFAGQSIASSDFIRTCCGGAN